MNVTFDEKDLRPLVDLIVATAIERLSDERAEFGDRLAYTEAQAAALLSVRPHVLRDARLRGEIAGCRLGKRVLYSHEQLVQFLRKGTGV